MNPEVAAHTPRTTIIKEPQASEQKEDKTSEHNQKKEVMNEEKQNQDEWIKIKQQQSITSKHNKEPQNNIKIIQNRCAVLEEDKEETAQIEEDNRNKINELKWKE